ncbi:flagellin N-terminal helical domain-containing protein [Radicibacter daui]|uniref:flagellin N-terminal helical domain-containing protein n=1 Tax=Radicibacter daui TaxID=3064829 RepID=UPI004046FE1C
MVDSIGSNGSALRSAQQASLTATTSTPGSATLTAAQIARAPRAGDSASNVSVSNNRGDSGAARGQRALSFGSSLVQSASDGLADIGSVLSQIGDLLDEGGNGSAPSDEERETLNARLDEIDRIAGDTRFEGAPLLAGKGPQTFALANDATPASTPSAITLSPASTQALGLGSLDLTTGAGRTAAREAVGAAQQFVTGQLSQLNATSAALEQSSAEVASINENQYAAGASFDTPPASAQASLLADPAGAYAAQTQNLPPALLSLIG